MVILLSTPLLTSISDTETHLEQVQRLGTLKVISRNGPTTYYQGIEDYEGFEYQLTLGFAKFLGVELEIIEEPVLSDIFNRVNGLEGDLGAAGLTVTDSRQHIALFSSPYLHVTQQLIYRTGTKKPNSVEDLEGKSLVVIAKSAHEEMLQTLKVNHPTLSWRSSPNVEMVELIEMVHEGVIDFTIVDSNAFSVNRDLYPRARVAFDISDPQPIAWALPNSADTTLQRAADQYFQQQSESGSLKKLVDRYLDRTTIGRGSAVTFTKRIRTRLPKWEPYLKEAGELFDIDWQLLAAMSYQESHWNQKAVSSTGVRGLMMLTRTTAKEMGVKDRTNPRQSILGGAKYFASIQSRVADSVEGVDRTWMALAAYNVGLGHLEDARKLTEKHGGDPNSWMDVEENLPLLSKRKYYQTLKYGYARGREPVQYVKAIRSYYNIIALNSHIEQRRSEALNLLAEDETTSDAYDADAIRSISLL